MNCNSLLLYCLISIAVGTVNGHETILGGDVANLQQFRFIVSLLEVNHGHICGGAIISEQHIVTAAHCFVNPDNSFKNKRVVALMGTTDLLKFVEPAVNLEVMKVYVPREYNATDINTTGDIAVLKLKEPLRLIKHKNLKKVKQLRNKNENFDGKRAKIVGWGWNEIEFKQNQLTGRRTDSLLRFAYADVLTNRQCQQEHTALKIYEEHLCARVEQIEYEHETYGVCHGDDGSPLVYNTIIIGVLSKYPYACTERSSPAIYTRVSHYLTFIRNAKEDYVTETMRAHVLRA